MPLEDDAGLGVFRNVLVASRRVLGVFKKIVVPLFRRFWLSLGGS